MRRFVFWTGVYDLVVGIGFFLPGLAPLLGIEQPESLFFVWSLALLVTYLGILLVFCSRDLSTRGTLVYWEGILRVVGFLLLGWFGFFGGIGVMIGVMGVIDLLIGIVYLVGLPRALHTTPVALLLDRVSAAGTGSRGS
jgi:hypothetical protein